MRVCQRSAAAAAKSPELSHSQLVLSTLSLELSLARCGKETSTSSSLQRRRESHRHAQMFTSTVPRKGRGATTWRLVSPHAIVGSSTSAAQRVEACGASFHSELRRDEQTPVLKQRHQPAKLAATLSEQDWIEHAPSSSYRHGLLVRSHQRSTRGLQTPLVLETETTETSSEAALTRDHHRDLRLVCWAELDKFKREFATERSCTALDQHACLPGRAALVTHSKPSRLALPRSSEGEC